MRILIKKGRLINPGGKSGVFDIFIEDGKVKEIGKNLNYKNSHIIKAENLYVFPGLIDMHSHLREPGREDEETIYTGSLSAVSGGFTTICCMPNTAPPLDNKIAIRFIYDRAKDALCEVLPIGCITVGREGKVLAPYGEMVEEGAVAFSDDGNCVMDSLIMRRALEYTKVFGKVIISHSEDQNLSKNGVMNEGALSTKMGLPGIPRQAEEIMVYRDVSLAELTGGKLHIAHITTSESVEILRRAKKKNKNISCEVTVHHFTLTEESVKGYNTNAKVSPPLRTEKDIEAIIEGIKDGTIDCIVTDHAPHTDEEKESGFEDAPYGIIGFETALPLSLKLTEKGIPIEVIISKFTICPAKILGIDRGKVEEGKRADIVIFDPNKEWIYRKEDIKSKSKNSPFIGWKLKGKVVYTIFNGKIVYSSEKEGK
ncbi:MAG TPA: dihydroorotase [bacterium]|nr:dihydroorotase [bacterium]